MKAKKRPKAGTSKAATVLTPQQEKFAQLVAAGAGYSDAYRQSYDAKRMKPATVNREAKALADNPKITARVAELRKPAIERISYELEDAMRETEEAMSMAREKLDPGGFVRAVALRAKLNGLMVEDRKNDRAPLEEMSDAELDSLVKQSAREAGVTLQ